MKLHYLPLIFLLAACHTSPDKGCDIAIPPAVSGLSFRMIDKTTGQDLLAIPGSGLNADSLTVVQPCYAAAVMPVFQQYTVPGSTEAAKIMSFSNLRNPGTDEAADCFSLLLKWGASNVDTVRWHYHIRPDGSCNYQVLDFMSINDQPAEKVDLKVFSYWALRR